MGEEKHTSSLLRNEEAHASLDSLEGVLHEEEVHGSQNPLERFKLLFPGVLVSIVIALAASFLSSHYGGPVMFFALLLGLAFDFLSQEKKTREGIEFSSRTILRLGVALLGARITVDQILAVGYVNVLAVGSAVLLTILSGALLARAMGVSREQGLLSGGAVAICGASAALALSSVMPKGPHSERNTIFTVVAVTTLSTIAMVFYPILVRLVGFSDFEAGVFLGGSIHDVAQVVGAGYTVSREAGDTSTIVKLLRVLLLLPTVVSFALLYRGQTGGETGKRPQLIPSFLIAFAALVVINSLGLLPQAVVAGLGDFSRWCLITAIAALGMKTSFKSLALIGWRPVLLVVLETLIMASIVFGYLLLHQS